MGTYFRWTEEDKGKYKADILGAGIDIRAFREDGKVVAVIPNVAMDPDTARMIGVRLIEAAVLADGERSIRAK